LWNEDYFRKSINFTEMKPLKVYLVSQGKSHAIKPNDQT